MWVRKKTGDKEVIVDLVADFLTKLDLQFRVRRSEGLFNSWVGDAGRFSDQLFRRAESLKERWRGRGMLL